MKKILLLMWVLLLGISIQAQTTTKEGNTITFSGYSAGDLATALAETDLSDVTKIVFSNCTLNADDFTAMSSTTHPELSGVKTVDMSNATVSVDTSEGSTATAISTMSGMNLSKMEYLRLPNNMTSADDVAEMKDLKKDPNNASLKMVGAYDGSPATGAKVALYSFIANSVPGFLTATGVPTSGNPNPMPTDIKMAGEYGENDLVNNGTPTMGWGTSALWDFTGAHFEDCAVSISGQDSGSYYDYDDPFCEDGVVSPSSSSNAFYYFRFYKDNVVNIKLPDVNMAHLPVKCLNEMGSNNKPGYIMLYGEDAFNANKAEDKCVPIETLTIPDCYTDLDYGCGDRARIRHLVVGSGMKRVHGYAFTTCAYLEDLDFAAGLSDCYLGDHAFHECRSMKHIALSEGIVSVGAYCFYNSQHLESIRLPETLINIGNHAFDNCLALNSITIPSNVDKIGQNAFTLCPFTDIFLTTTDPAKIPIIWSAGSTGSGYGVSTTCSFYNNHMNAWNAIEGFREDKKEMFKDMTWEQATAYYYIHANGVPVLHYPKQLADKVHASISSTYYAASSEGYGLPIYSDVSKRGSIPGTDLGDTNGKYTRDGWAQFLLMKEFTTDPGEDVYQKEYKDVWYTMCFPFDLTDEQLAAAFNETFNIVDFSGIEVNDVPSKTDPTKIVKQMILHFDQVAITDYKDTNSKHYKRMLDDNGNVIRVQDGTFKYNVYYDTDGQQYWHVKPFAEENLNKTKTKTFAKGTSLETAQNNYNSTGEAFIIDGILATAGHPYMIHPAIGVKAGSPAKRCNFSGITWLEQSKWAKAFEDNSRTIDLGIKKTIEELPDSNYNHKGYAEYANKKQKYTFIGNPKIYRDDAQQAIGNEPPIPETPIKPRQLTTEELEALKPSGEEITEAPTIVQDPEKNSKYSDDFKTLFKTVRCSYTGWHAPTQDQNHLYEFTYGEDIDAYDAGEFLEFKQWDNNVEVNAYFFRTQASQHNSSAVQNIDKLKAILGDEPVADLEGFTALKNLVNDYNRDKAAYAAYQIDFALWTSWQAYRALVKHYTTDWNQDEVDAEYDEALRVYNDAVAAHTEWEKTASTYKVLIPQYAYFLGTKAGELYPKYFREMREDQTPRDKGVWNQFTAVIIPNKAALKGLEAELDGKEPAVSGAKIAYNEDYFVFDDTPQGIATLIEKIEKEEGKAPEVEYMDIVVSIDGKIVSRDKTTFEGLPKGVYIINGKKYYVK